MATLWLLRHAKSAWDEAALDDHDRPLAPRGIRACELLRAHCEGRVQPEVIVCSTARRTRQTLERVWPDVPASGVHFERDVYEAPAERLRACIEHHGRGARSLLLVGHNPGIQELSLWLAAAPGDREARSLLERLGEKLPTGALVRFELADLAVLSRGGATLRAFVTPKRLARG